MTTSAFRRGFTHVKCRGEFYPRTENKVRRLQVPDDKVSWDAAFPDYRPTNFTSEHVLKGPVWADKDDLTTGNYKWNCLDNNVDRRSHLGEYNLDSQGRPLNPRGRTGISGRGCLGRWGPNHAADPVVTRWSIDPSTGKILQAKGQPVLQFVSILRGDCNEWALPGGMVDPGESFSTTLLREFVEEAMDMSTSAEKEKVKEFFATGGTEIYRGYVDDPRNTDNSWMETVVVNYHDRDGTYFKNIKLKSGDDAIGVQWKNLTDDLKLYASHSFFLKKVKELHLNGN
ncbi:ADP-ribose pyrophosphatase, mitochondrial [Neocloeon triangulifer]|uniref:ADP-ribose pyrophosphatase, mitochondrial n=1 Tax=Neocloeon triangulifer TaxID=2078957 RepID=UPI00286F56C1|nr:ADP-ribose pyrophosphatase, mitochondrial [Neocloeon triangulifer]